MDKPAERISDSELELMKVLWEAEDALPLAVIREKLRKTRDWEPTTIKTLLSRLVSKSAVRQEKREVYYYSPAISEREYDEWATGELISKLYKGSAKNLVAALVNSKELSESDIAELRAMFRVED